MLTETELPGFPPLDPRPRCPGCEKLLFATEDDWTDYGQGELEAWEASLASYIVPEGQVPDSRGKLGNHKNTCVYSDLPPIALRHGTTVANRVRAAIRQTRRGSA
ncbi:hypothetical protein ACFXPN_05385 [Streptomyces griseorubiginosus]|uniref:hypothetical protein n=1 Tax=Streptomyces griseorubiginosus TaxID=67304 RepID=UPI002E823398|nr:hypothetical protein [Streptomyces griseorubiginosus]WUB44776.1 hypothetical protein OHN19_16100 [Streptomyces griseorubiginosus]WUB53293.1 hypothetical protein OG942_16095 [Streptomyces griseorubiginosus]